MSKNKNAIPAGDHTAKEETKESKSEKFIRLAEERVSKAIQRMRMVAQLSNRQTYEYESAQVDRIIQALQTELNAITDAFEGTSKPRRAFSLSD